MAEIKKRKRKSKMPCDSISYTTGDIGLNIDHFNRAMGTAESSMSTEASGTLAESKRYVRRYYIRPQNRFCSNKTEIIKALIEIGNEDCSIYTLNNLGDEKDVSKLMSSDIIYYYDDGILYDKNRVKVMDYDLSIKKEEDRKHFSNVNKAPDKEFKAEYSDRMTNATELEEKLETNKLGFTCEELKTALDKAAQKGKALYLGRSFNNESACDYDWEINYLQDEVVVTGWGYNIYTEEDGIENSEYFKTIEDAYEYLESLAHADINAELSLNKTNEAFDLDFDDITVFGEKLTEAKENYCCICGEPIEGHGNNPEPFMSSIDGSCCAGCNLKFVVPARLNSIKEV
jgi:hypothetical protein